MFGSSELSDALNPYYYLNAQAVGSNEPPSNPSPTANNHNSQQTINTSNYVPNYMRNPQDLHSPIVNNVHTEHTSYIPHRSELHDAINPSTSAEEHTQTAHPHPAEVAQVAQAAPRTRPRRTIDSIEFMRGLVAAISSYKDAAEAEKRRRLAWEKEQEERYNRQEADFERRLAELQAQVNDLRLQVAPPSSTHGEVGDASTADIVLEQPEFVQGSSTFTAPNAHFGKRSRSSVSLDGDRETIKLRSALDRRPKTIQAAMRNHILKMMDLESDKFLPLSHVEGDSDGDGDDALIRFVWERTTKRSAHNNKMKSRVIADILAKKDMYPLVPAQEFDEGNLGKIFEQAFTTLRQKATDTVNSGKEDNKARRSRRASRKKAKLTRRISTRKEFAEYSSSAFDIAFHIECMSSEESSEGEVDAETGTKQGDILRIRYLEWRSRRLQRLYQILDEREEAERKEKPKRGVGRKNRQLGLPKYGNPPPPKGVTRWMVSKKWLQEAHMNNPSLGTLVEQILASTDEQNELDWDDVVTLGEESEVEGSGVHPTMSEQGMYHDQQGVTMMMDPSPWADSYSTLYNVHNR